MTTLIYLTEKIQAEVGRTQKNTEYDIDRINTFLAIGLALLAIFGGLLPLVVNFFSKELIESKIESHAAVIKECQDNIKSANHNATKAKEDASNALENMQGFEGRIKTIEKGIENLIKIIKPVADEVETAKIDVGAVSDKIPFISSLVLQNAVARLLSVSNIRYYTESNRYKKLSKVLEGIISGMDLCKNDGFNNHHHENFNYLIDVITDLKIGFQFSTFRLNLDRKLQKEIDEFAVYLDNFKIENKHQFKTLLEVAATKLTAIKNGINNIES